MAARPYGTLFVAMRHRTDKTWRQTTPTCHPLRANLCAAEGRVDRAFVGERGGVGDDLVAVRDAELVIVVGAHGRAEDGRVLDPLDSRHRDVRAELRRSLGLDGPSSAQMNLRIKERRARYKVRRKKK